MTLFRALILILLSLLATQISLNAASDTTQKDVVAVENVVMAYIVVEADMIEERQVVEIRDFCFRNNVKIRETGKHVVFAGDKKALLLILDFLFLRIEKLPIDVQTGV